MTVVLSWGPQGTPSSFEKFTAGQRSHLNFKDQCHFQYNTTKSLITDDLQLGFKENSSTIICTQLLMEIIEYYNSNNTDWFMLLLDASTAFDRIEYSTLFNNLRSRNMCPVTLRLIMNMYISQKMQVRFSNVLSSQFTVGNGVKQGGVLRL